MLELAREQMGDDGDSNPLHPFLEAAVAAGRRGLEYFNAQRRSDCRNPVLRPLIERGRAERRAAAAPRRRRMASRSGIRYYQDLFVPKLPVVEDRPATAATARRAFHQDFITFAVDRTGGMTFWFPLEAYGPEAGTMSFVNGSHRAGVMGDYTTYGGGDALDAFPELRGARDVGADAPTSSATSPSTPT